MTMLQICHIELALYKAIQSMDNNKIITGAVGDFRSRYVQLCRAKDKSEWIKYDSYIPLKWQRDILYDFFSEESKFLLMLES